VRMQTSFRSDWKRSRITFTAAVHSDFSYGITSRKSYHSGILIKFETVTAERKQKRSSNDSAC
jgi:hypothetical protein